MFLAIIVDQSLDLQLVCVQKRRTLWNSNKLFGGCFDLFDVYPVQADSPLIILVPIDPDPPS